jgi:hypothetical protein
MAGAVIVLGGVGAALALRGGAKLAAGRARADSVRPGPAAGPADTVAAPAGRSAGPRGPERPPRRQPRTVVPSKPAVPRIDVSRAKELLDTLFLNQLQPKTAHMVRDSASDLFNAPGISQRDKAYAALVIGMSFLFQQYPDRAKNCVWLRRAAQLDSTSRASQLARQAQCPP